MNKLKIESCTDAMCEVAKDIAYNLRRIVLINGGGEWQGVRTIGIEPHQSVMIDFVNEQASRLITIINIDPNKEVKLFSDPAYQTSEALMEEHSYPLFPGMTKSFLLEYKEGIFAYNSFDDTIFIKVETYAMRTCHFSL